MITSKIRDFNLKQDLQYLVFPNGLLFNKEKSNYLTPNANTIFSCISSTASLLDEMKNGQPSSKTQLSVLVERTGIEPVIPP